MKTAVKENLFISLIIVSGLVLRLWGINFGLPLPECRPDESTIIEIAINFFHGDLNPHFFNYPTLYLYTLSFVYIIYFFIGKVTGTYVLLTDIIVEYLTDPTNLFLIDRCLSAFLGTATIFVVYKIAHRLFDKKTALFSSLLFSFAYLHIRDSHFGVTDVAMTFLITCAFFFIVKTYDSNSYKDFILAGIFSGLATSTKYNGLLLTAPILVVQYLNSKGKIKQFFNKKILLFFLFFVAAFFVGTPFALIDFSTFITDFLYEMKHINSFHEVFLGQGWGYHLKISLFHGMGWGGLFTSAAGIVLLIKKDIKKAAILCAFPFIYYIAIGKGYTVFVRYAIPLIPFLCITGGIFLSYISDKLTDRFSGSISKTLTSFIIIVIIAPSLTNAIRFNTLLSKKDNRLIAAEWIEKNIQKGASIYQTGSYWTKIKLSNFKQWEFDEKTGYFTVHHKVSEDLPEVIIIEEHPPLHIYNTIPIQIEQLINQSYRLKEYFPAMDINYKKNIYDLQDAFYIPFAGFKKITRPGPNIYIFNRVLAQNRRN